MYTIDLTNHSIEHEILLVAPSEKGTSNGQLLFWDDNRWNYTETSELFWDDANKRFGVGIATPSQKLEVNGGAKVDYLILPTASSATQIASHSIYVDDSFNNIWLNAPTGERINLSIAGSNKIQMTSTVAFFNINLDMNGNNIYDVGTIAIGTGTANEALTLGTDGVLSMNERVAAPSATAAYGKLWVKTATPNQLWFTDDAGTSTQIV